MNAYEKTAPLKQKCVWSVQLMKIGGKMKNPIRMTQYNKLMTKNIGLITPDKIANINESIKRNLRRSCRLVQSLCHSIFSADMFPSIAKDYMKRENVASSL